MCGICGIWYFDPERQVENNLLHSMTLKLAHRGPDGEDFYVSGSCGLGFRRLAILDIEGSNQPLSNENQKLWLVCNGEIYNYPELRSALASRHDFRTKGDAETILHLYEEYDKCFVDKLRGMFALALWDQGAEKLTLAVDRFGKKPLYFLIDAEKIAFASELKALLHLPQVRLDLDYEALDEYLTYGYISAPRSIFKGIRKLSPGQIMVVQRDGVVRFETYWQPQFAPQTRQAKRSFNELAFELKHLLLEAVRLRLASDVPVGAFLSGGLDSSTVVALMTTIMTAPVKTFSIGFENPVYDESTYAHTVAEHFQSEHHFEIIRDDSLELLPKLVDQYDEPFADSSMIPTYLLSRLARKQVVVALSGDGGDEVFGGYHQHLYAYRQQFLRSVIPAPLYAPTAKIASLFPLASKVHPYFTDKPAQEWLSSGFFSTAQRQSLYRKETYQRVASYDSKQIERDIFQHLSKLDGTSQLQTHDLRHYLPGDILAKLDRASMMASLEVRSPLLDHKVFEFMAQVPAQHRVGIASGKTLLKQAMKSELPAHILRRKKQGFSIPQGEWLRGKLSPQLNDLVFVKTLFEPTYIQTLVDEHKAGIVDHKDRLWALLCLELWMSQHKSTLSR